jgi:hypothetical protein
MNLPIARTRDEDSAQTLGQRYIGSVADMTHPSSDSLGPVQSRSRWSNWRRN